MFGADTHRKCERLGDNSFSHWSLLARSGDHAANSLGVTKPDNFKFEGQRATSQLRTQLVTIQYVALPANQG